LRWFVTFFATDSMRTAFLRSVQIAVVSAAAATILGTMASLSAARRKGLAIALLQALFLAPLIFPCNCARAVAASILQADRRHA
jgi:putative spermidine/putrescine transport system permease protein